MYDLWNANHFPNATYGRPAKALVNSVGCSFQHQNATTISGKSAGGGRCIYEDDIFEDRVHHVIKNHNRSEPLFVFWATHTVHGPLQPPDASYAEFAFINNDARRKYHSMVNYIDRSIGRVVQSLKEANMYEDSLIIFSSDNGGPIGSANNYPLKGGKFSNWEGGIRVAAFASGGFLPEGVRGTKQTGLMAGWDWYATLAGLAGVDPTDTKAVEAGLPPIDSLDMWPLISGVNQTSPRRRLEIGSNVGGDDYGRKSGDTLVGGLLIPPYKILLGDGYNDTIDNAAWPGPQHPNNSKVDQHISAYKAVCGRTPSTGCLYNVYDDPEEHKNLAATKPDLYNLMLKELQMVQTGVYSPARGTDDNTACTQGLTDYGGFWGPFLFDDTLE